MLDLRKIYNFYPITPPPPSDELPAGGELYYVCTNCDSVVNSVPHIKVGCLCGNIEGSSGKVTIKNTQTIQVVKGKLK